jgi:hypothetical protein
MMMVANGLALDPAKAKPAPVNPTPKELIMRYKKLYEIATLFTIVSSSLLDSWECYSCRAVVFNEMHEYDLAWQDCMRSISLVESGFTSVPPPNKYGI